MINRIELLRRRRRMHRRIQDLLAERRLAVARGDTEAGATTADEVAEHRD